MVTMLMSMLILVVPVVSFLIVSVYLWRRGLFGRGCLLSILIAGAMEVHSVVNPDARIREKYAEIILI